MELRLDEGPIDRLSEHAQVPISFTTERVLAVSAPNAGLGELVLREVAVASPWVKDYDTVEGEGPTRSRALPPRGLKGGSESAPDP